MWRQVSILIGIIGAVAVVSFEYKDLKDGVADVEEIRAWKKSIEEYQRSSKQEQCIDDIAIGYKKAHGDDNEPWCPDHYFITKIDIDGFDPSIAYSPQEKDSNNFPIIGTVKCCRALPPPVTKN